MDSNNTFSTIFNLTSTIHPGPPLNTTNSKLQTNTMDIMDCPTAFDFSNLLANTRLPNLTIHRSSNADLDIQSSLFDSLLADCEATSAIPSPQHQHDGKHHESLFAPAAEFNQFNVDLDAVDIDADVGGDFDLSSSGFLSVHSLSCSMDNNNNNNIDNIDNGSSRSSSSFDNIMGMFGSDTITATTGTEAINIANGINGRTALSSSSSPTPTTTSSSSVASLTSSSSRSPSDAGSLDAEDLLTTYGWGPGLIHGTRSMGSFDVDVVGVNPTAVTGAGGRSTDTSMMGMEMAVEDTMSTFEASVGSLLMHHQNPPDANSSAMDSMVSALEFLKSLGGDEVSLTHVNR
jgi:hypothetical protein